MLSSASGGVEVVMEIIDRFLYNYASSVWKMPVLLIGQLSNKWYARTLKEHTNNYR